MDFRSPPLSLHPISRPGEKEKEQERDLFWSNICSEHSSCIFGQLERREKVAFFAHSPIVSGVIVFFSLVCAVRNLGGI